MQINKITLVSIDERIYVYDFSSKLVFIHASNDYGKTRVAQTIDFMLGSSSLDDLFHKEGMDNLKEIILEINDSNRTFCLKRNSENECFYKPNEKSEFLSLTLVEYNEIITKHIDKNNKISYLIREYMDEEVKHRTFSFLNSINENGYGLSKQLFQKFNDPTLFFRSPKIIKALFNENLSEIEKLKRLNKQLEKELKLLERLQIKIDLLENSVNKSLVSLGINYVFAGDIKETKKVLNDYLINTKPKIKPISKDVEELKVIKNNLDEKIKILKQEQSNLKYNLLKQKTSINLLSDLELYMKKSPELEYLINPVKQLIKDKNESIGFLDYNDYKKSIRKLVDFRNDIIIKIEKSDINLKMYSEQDKVKYISHIEKLIEDYEKNKTDEISYVRNEIAKNKEQILKLSNDYNKITEESVNNLISTYYGYLKDKNINYVEVDYSQNGFAIRYDPKTNKLITTKESTIMDYKTNKERVVDELYYPGSLARETTYQIATYFAFLKVFIEKTYPVYPIFVLDSVSQPFSKNSDINNLAAIRHLIQLFIKNTEVQVIWIDFNNESILEEIESLDYKEKIMINLMDKTNDLSIGFNPFHQCNK